MTWFIHDSESVTRQPKNSAKCCVLVVALIAAVAVAAPARGGVVELIAVGDVYLDAAGPSQNCDTATTNRPNYNCRLWARRSGSSSRRSLVQFTLPANLKGATVTSATLRLWVQHWAVDHPVSVHRVDHPWAEAKAGWATFDGQFSWPPADGSGGAGSCIVPEADRRTAADVKGADRSGRIKGPLDDETVYVDFDVTTIARDWSRGKMNAGVLLKAQREGSELAGFWDRETRGRHKAGPPTLRIDYEPAPGAPEGVIEPAPLPTLVGSGRYRFVYVRPGKRIYCPQHNIYLSEPGQPERCLTPGPAQSMSPRWSPDGKWIAFSSWRDMEFKKKYISEREIPAWREARNHEIWIVDPASVDSESGDRRRLTDHPAYDGTPVWSPDGNQIAFVSERAAKGVPQVFVMNRDGAEVRQLTRMPYGAGDPCWSPDGRQIAFMGRDDKTFSIYRVQSDGSGLVPLTDEPADDRYPVWLPDGTTIAFSSLRPDYRSAYWKVWAMSAEDGRNLRALGDHESPNYVFPSRFHDEGRRLLCWSIGHSFGYSVWSLALDGSNRRVLGITGGGAYLPDLFEAARE